MNPPFIHALADVQSVEISVKDSVLIVDSVWVSHKCSLMVVNPNGS